MLTLSKALSSIMQELVKPNPEKKLDAMENLEREVSQGGVVLVSLIPAVPRATPAGLVGLRARPEGAAVQTDWLDVGALWERTPAQVF
jgi:hypothetical protein